MGRRRYQWLGWINPEWVLEIRAKLEAGEEVWVVNQTETPTGRPGKERPAMVTAAYVSDDENGRIHLDFGPYGDWGDKAPEWTEKPAEET